MPPQSHITILGAGIGGLTLGQCLRKKGISSVLYEKVSASTQRHSYGITLHPSSSEALSELLNLDIQTFRKRTAVDRLYQDGVGSLQSGGSELSTRDPPASFRANRARLEELLREGLNIKYGHPVESAIRISTLTNPSSLLVDALGIHSPLRISFLPRSTPTVLPYVVFNGRHRIALEKYEKTYDEHFREVGSACSTHHPDSTGDKSVRLEISINDIDPSAPPLPGFSSPGEVDISYTYSRPVFTSSPDLLHNPTRSNASASTIPEEFYSELASLTIRKGAFTSAFSPNMVRQYRVLHWLMRTILPSRADLSSLASQGILIIGDAVHATPILGGNGANAAIRDAVELAAAINISGMMTSPHGNPGGTDKVSNQGVPLSGTDPDWKTMIERFYDDSYERWKNELEMSGEVIAEMHGQHAEDVSERKGKRKKAKADL